MKDNNRNIQFSVVIPAYNAAATIVSSVRSCLEQSYPPQEIIVVDDGSSDGTADLLQERFGEAVTLIRCRDNQGPSHARNRGMDQATADFIVFQDADDVWHRDKLSLIAAALQQSSIRFLFHPYTLGGMDFNARERQAKAVRYPFLKLLFSNPIGTPCTALVNDGRYRFNERMHHMEDYELFLRAGSDYGIYFLDVPLTQLGRPILSAGGQSANRWAMRKGEFTALLQLARYKPVYFLLLPFLVLGGLFKHVVKSFFPPRSNY